MKKVFMLLLVAMFAMSFPVSCTPLDNEDDQEQSIDPDETCPPNDRNCNGIPDDEEQ